MSSVEEARTELERPDQKVVAMMAWVDLAPRDLVEQLLDSPSRTLVGRPFRFGTDDSSRVVVVETEHASELRAVVERLGQAPLSEDDQRVLGQLSEDMKTQCGLEQDPAELVYRVKWRQVDIAGASGACAVLWGQQEAPTSAVLTCRECGEPYDLAQSARIVLDEDMDVILEEAGSIVAGPVEPPAPSPELVLSGKPFAEDQLSLRTVLKELRGGREHRWRCDGCDAVQGYPGTFIFHEFS